MNRGVNLTFVKPNEVKWNDYIKQSVSYIKESWPNAVGNDQERFAREYDVSLRERSRENGRYFILLNNWYEDIGLSNCYENRLFSAGCKVPSGKAFCVAEFCIYSPFRRNKFGSAAVQSLIKFAREKEMDLIVAEVDKTLKRANKLWQNQLENLDCTGERNIYWKDLTSK